MIILDTNVISEGWRIRPDQAVRAWLDAQKPTELFLCAPVLAELRYGVERLSPGARRRELGRAVAAMETDLFANRLLVFDRECAHEFGRVVAVRARIGRTITPIDAMIAAIAISNRMAVATRDIDGFSDVGLDLINPFESTISAR